MKQRKIFMRIASLFLWMLMFVGTICNGYAWDGGRTETVETEGKTLIEYTADDITVIPDMYNTGACGELYTVEIADTVEGLVFKGGNNNTRNVLDFYYRNTDIEGTIEFNNYDFSGYGFSTTSEDKLNRNIKLVFNNCKFGEISTGKSDSCLAFEFNNCTIARFVGSNAVFNNCNMGKGCYSDALVPFRNIEVNSCFFNDMGGGADSGKEIHTDGTQIYGFKGIDVENVHYNNCRFEIPNIYVEGSTIYVNACLMLQLEYSDGNDITFSNCVINGGGYSIFARGVNDCTLENVKFEGIRSGCAKKFGTVYPDVSSGVEMVDFNETEHLYVASVWQEGTDTCFSVSNDTNKERKLLIVTDCGEYEYTIPACPTGSEVVSGMVYDDMPFDIVVSVPEKCEYAICYDNTADRAAKQIRFVNWTGEDVYLDVEKVDDLTAGSEDVILSGSCGKDAEYTLTMSGVLTISGTGSTDDYHSAKPQPWSEYNNIIRQVIVEEGIEGIGNQIFRKCVAINSVSLPEGLKVIGSRAFASCTSLTEITVPTTVEVIGASAFSGAVITKINYNGDNWDAIELGTGNENLSGMIVGAVYEEPAESKVVLQGSCGKNAEFVLTEDGEFRVTGFGAMDDYHSAKLPPWNDVKDMITTVVIEAGIESVGSQAFRKCSNIAEVVLPDGLLLIGNNAFSSCKLISNIVMPETIKEIHKYAFSGISTIEVQYVGSCEAWNEIAIGVKNESILANVIFER